MLGDDLDHAVRQGAGREKAKILGATHQINEAGMVDQIDGAFGGPLQHLGRLVAGYLRGRRPRSGNPPLVLVTNVTLLKIGCRFLDMIILQTEPSYSWPLGQRYGLQSLLIIFAICLGCSSSRAQPGPTAQDREACGADVEKLCTGSTPKPGDETVLNCLVAHKSELSDVCRRNVEAHTSAAPPPINSPITTATIKRCPDGFEPVIRTDLRRGCAKEVVPANE